MNTKDKVKLNKKIKETLNVFIGELNGDATRDKIAYTIKEFLEKEKMDFETVNLYTSPKKVDMGLVDICVDGQYYPFSVINDLNKDNYGDFVAEWETGELNEADTMKLFQFLIDEGLAWNMGKIISRIAEDLVESGFCTFPNKHTMGHYLGIKLEIPSKKDLKCGDVGTDVYVQNIEKKRLKKIKGTF